MLTQKLTRFNDALGKAFVEGLALPGREKYGRGGTVLNENLQKRLSADANLSTLPAVGQQLRQSYGKTGPAPPPRIGDHPDFESLKGTDEVTYCPITTMFMDIEASTRLGIRFPAAQVRGIKNSFIKTAIQIVKAFDGHVHRIMGDAVMAFFGGRNSTDEDAVIDGLNCASILCHFTENVVIPTLTSAGYGEDFGIRIGLDYGPEKEVLWGSYGYPGMDEVTATSYYVDIAAKLQQSAGRNQIMIGDSLRQAVDFPSDLIEKKYCIKGDLQVPEPYVTPNYTDDKGRPRNYRQYVLKAQQYLLASPVIDVRPQPSTEILPVAMSTEVFSTIDPGRSEGHYCSSSRALPKNRDLVFRVHLLPPDSFPCIIHFDVENHGQEACADGRDDCDNHSQKYPVKDQGELAALSHREHTKYRGLQYMTVRVEKEGKILGLTRCGIYIE